MESPFARLIIDWGGFYFFIRPRERRVFKFLSIWALKLQGGPDGNDLFQGRALEKLFLLRHAAFGVERFGKLFGSLNGEQWCVKFCEREYCKEYLNGAIFSKSLCFFLYVKYSSNYLTFNFDLFSILVYLPMYLTAK